MSHHHFANATLAIVLLIGLAGAQPASARPLAAIAADGTLRVGMTGDYAPFAVRGADDRISGADVTMAKSLAKALGVALVIVPTSWKTLAADLTADRYDVAMGGVSITPDRAALGEFTHPVRWQTADRTLRREGSLHVASRDRSRRRTGRGQSRRHQRALCQGEPRSRDDRRACRQPQHL
jgi:membrane-bound lytic murein transglycosylase MltF